MAHVLAAILDSFSRVPCVVYPSSSAEMSVIGSISDMPRDYLIIDIPDDEIQHLSHAQLIALVRKQSQNFRTAMERERSAHDSELETRRKIAFVDPMFVPETIVKLRTNVNVIAIVNVAAQSTCRASIKWLVIFPTVTY